MNNDEWRDRAPEITKPFNKAAEYKPATKKELEELEAVAAKEKEQIEKAQEEASKKKSDVPTLELKPAGKGHSSEASTRPPSPTIDPEREKRMEELKTRLQAKQGKARDAFEQSREAGL